MLLLITLVFMTLSNYTWSCIIEQIHKGIGGDKKTSQGSGSRNKNLQAEIGESSNFERCCI
jgi:hypothetical protein